MQTISGLLLLNVYSKVNIVFWFKRTDVALCQVSICCQSDPFYIVMESQSVLH